MNRWLGSVVYPVAKAVERASAHFGYGEFEVPDAYKCIECHEDPSIPECLQCRVAWVREVGHMDYSDAYERRMNIMLGILGLTLAASSWLLNNALDWWEFGPFLASLNAVLLAYTPDLSSLPAAIRGIYVVVLGCVWGMSLLGISAGFCNATFFLVMNPTSKRHWRHMTPSAIFTLVVMGVVYFVILLQRVYLMDGLLVVIPAFMGVLALLLVLCMRKTEDKGDEGGVGKLV